MISLKDSIMSELEEIGKKKVRELADKARDDLSKKYMSLLNMYYEDYTPKKDKFGAFYYERTYNLKKSCIPYRKDSHGMIVYGGVKIASDKMNDYQSIYGYDFPAERLLDKYIYTTTLPSATWHGGDYYGGYGVMAKFSIYDEMKKYQNELIKQYTKQFGAK